MNDLELVNEIFSNKKLYTEEVNIISKILKAINVQTSKPIEKANVQVEKSLIKSSEITETLNGKYDSCRGSKQLSLKIDSLIAGKKFNEDGREMFFASMIPQTKIDITLTQSIENQKCNYKVEGTVEISKHFHSIKSSASESGAVAASELSGNSWGESFAVSGSDQDVELTLMGRVCDSSDPSYAICNYKLI